MTYHQDLGTRIQRLEDLEAIRNLHRDYIFWLNNREWDKIVDCFAVDAQIQVFYHSRADGIAQIRKLFFDEISTINTGKGRDAHFTTMPVIRVEGTKASGHWMLYIMISDAVTGQPQKILQGRYECEYEKLAGHWKYSKVCWVCPWPRTPESKPTLEDVRVLGFDY
ncbi:MAG TPA: nuclear transport factor 2 family protein [Dehalococcoidales bacterium]|nr:nuclear transport factor 2 family protein [Dehalococcoidales bacterium]